MYLFFPFSNQEVNYYNAVIQGLIFLKKSQLFLLKMKRKKVTSSYVRELWPKMVMYGYIVSVCIVTALCSS